jgi:hypothetical protein
MHVIFPYHRGPSDLGDLMRMTLDGSREISPLVQSRFNEGSGAVSRNGRWLAYQSNDSGRAEIYVRPYPDTQRGRWQVSTNGGSGVRWSHDGQELFFVSPARELMGVTFDASGATWEASRPAKVLEPGYWSSPSLIGAHFDVAPDGRFLVLTPSPSDPRAMAPHLVLAQDWAEEVTALVPER